MQAHQQIEFVFHHDLQIKTRQQIMQLGALINGLAFAPFVNQVAKLLPVLERRTLGITPEFGAPVQRCQIDQCFCVSQCRPVRSAALCVLLEVKAEGGRLGLFLNGANIEIAGRRDFAFGQRNKILHWIQRAGAKYFARCKLRGLDGRRKVWEQRRAIFDTEQDVGKEHWQHLRQRTRIGGIHVLDVGIINPARVNGFN